MKKSNYNLRDLLTKELYEQVKHRTDLKSLEKFDGHFWMNPRHPNNTGWRLTDFGFQVMCELDYREFPINIPEELGALSSQTLLGMNRYIEGPWYLKDGVIHCFKEKTAFQLMLYGGDVSLYAQSRNRSDLL